MKRLFNLFLIIVSIIDLNAQSIPGSLSKANLTEENLISKFTHFDFSSMITKNDTQFLGFIGDNFERIKIKYISVTKDSINPKEYHVTGKTKVKSYVRSFKGNIEIYHIRHIIKDEYVKEVLKHANKEEADVYSKDEYFLFANYKYFEDANETETGIFIGTLTLKFYIERGSVHYDELELGIDDRFSNNQYKGKWTAYKSGITKECNWGDYRIPDSGDLDYGAGLFSPNEKYFKNGWQSYNDAIFSRNRQAKMHEEEKWW
jgi:hypothetical protein